MRTLVILAVLGFCSAFPFIPDAPDVAAEKAKFIRTFKLIEGATSPIGAPEIPIQASVPSHLFTQPQPQAKWYGPLASQVPASLPGSSAFVADTPEVHNAKSHFFNTYRAQIAATKPKPGSPIYQYTPQPYSVPVVAPVYTKDPPKWTGPLASSVPASVPGSSPIVYDTPEVAKAKAAFLDTYKRQVSAVAPVSYF